MSRSERQKIKKKEKEAKVKRFTSQRLRGSADGERASCPGGEFCSGQTSLEALLTTQRKSPPCAKTKTRTGYWARGHAGDADLRGGSATPR